jgi:hypothetical protein
LQEGYSDRFSINSLKYILLLKKFVPEVFVQKEFTTTIGSRQLDERIAVKNERITVIGNNNFKDNYSLTERRKY